MVSTSPCDVRALYTLSELCDVSVLVLVPNLRERSLQIGISLLEIVGL